MALFATIANLHPLLPRSPCFAEVRRIKLREVAGLSGSPTPPSSTPPPRFCRFPKPSTPGDQLQPGKDSSNWDTSEWPGPVSV